MTNTYHTIHKILCSTLSIKQGDKGLVRSWLISTHYYFDSNKKLDIMDAQDFVNYQYQWHADAAQHQHLLVRRGTVLQTLNFEH
jgi:hypothetical protein